MLQIFTNHVLPKLREKKGQGMVEYALLIGLIAIVVIAALVALGPTIAQKFNDINTQLSK